VSGAEIAGGHAAELVRRLPLPRPELARAFAGDVAEGAPEGAQAFPPGPERDLSDGEVGVAEQGRGPLDPPRKEVPVRRQAEGLLERPREMGLGDAAHAGEAADGPGLTRGGVHPVLRPEQAA
jgi:hypothetical protein